MAQDNDQDNYDGDGKTNEIIEYANLNPEDPKTLLEKPTSS